MPKLIKRAETVLGLTEQEKFVLSLIDGRTSVQEIARTTGFGLGSAKKILEKLKEHHVIEFHQEKQEHPKDQPQEQSIKDLYLNYENADPHTILGIPEGAPLERIKEAYFEKTKMFHPDSYYARSVSPDDKHFLVDIYKKVQQAYETLKNSAPLKTVQAKTVSSPAIEIPKEEKPAPAGAKVIVQQPQKAALDNQIKDNIKKGEAHYKIGLEAFFKNDYASAFLNFKLAHSYNPYKQEFILKMNEAETHMKRYRYEDLLKKADMSIGIDKPADAIGYLKTALELTDEKKFAYYKLALVMHDFNQSLKEAAKYCQQAIVLDPKNPDCHLLLAKIYKKVGLLKSSMVEYEQTMALGAKTDDIKAEIKQLKGMMK